MLSLMRIWAIWLVLAFASIPAIAAADDSTPPVIREVSFARATYGPGDQVSAVILVDDESPVQAALLTVHDTQSSLSFDDLQCSAPSGANPAKVTCVFQLPQKVPGGRFAIRNVWAVDAVGHTVDHQGTTLGAFGSVGFDVDSPYTDRKGPLINDVHLEDAHVKDGEDVVASFTATDPSGLTHATMGFQRPNQPVLATPCSINEAPIVRCRLRIPPGYPQGTLTFHWAAAWDSIGYEGLLHGNQLTPPLTVQIESATSDSSPPILEGIDMPDAPVPKGAPFLIRLTTADESSLGASYVALQTKHGNARLTTDHCQVQTAVLACPGAIPGNFPQGEVRVEAVSVTDQHGNLLHAFPPWIDCYGCPELEDRPPYELRFLVGPRPLQVADEQPVKALDPFFADVSPGAVLPVVVHVTDSVQELAFQFTGTTSDALDKHLAVAGCPPSSNRTVIGSLCHLIVPYNASVGAYRLAEVRIRSTNDAWSTIPFESNSAPSFAVTADSESPAYSLPSSWMAHTTNGVTEAAFNGIGSTFTMPRLVDPAATPIELSDGDLEDESSNSSTPDDVSASSIPADPQESPAGGAPYLFHENIASDESAGQQEWAAESAQSGPAPEDQDSRPLAASSGLAALALATAFVMQRSKRN